MRPSLLSTRPLRFCRPSLALAATVFSLAIAGCGRSTSTPDTGSAPSAAPDAKSSAGTGSGAGNFKVALVMSGPTSDNSWNAGAYKALQSVKQALKLSDADAASVDSQTSDSQQNESLNSFATQKFNIIFAHGHEYQGPALKMEKDFPNTLFVVSSGDKIGSNTTPIILKLEDGAYLEGMLAAGMSKTHILASVGAEKIPPVQSAFEAFEKGAKAVDPNVKVLQPAYTGSWDDVTKAKEQTLALITQNADVIMQDVDSAAQGVFNAVSSSSTPGKPIYALGTNNDQNAVAPDVILASAPILIDKAFVDIATQVKANTYKPGTTPYDMKSGVIGFVLNPKLANKIPADLKQKIDAAQKRILDGSLLIPKAG
jgi:basic membrane protein A